MKKKIIPIYILLGLAILMLCPFWIFLLLNTFFINICNRAYLIPAISLQLICSTLLISSIDITGDLANYKYLFDNIDLERVTYEFESEPSIIYIFKFLNLIGINFNEVIFLLSLLFNSFLFILALKSKDYRYVRFLGLLLAYPVYIQTQLYLVRQSLSIIFLLYFLSISKLKYKLPFLILSILSHSVSIIYFLIIASSSLFKKKSISRVYILILIFITILIPVNIETLSSVINDFIDISYSINRKINFFINKEEIQASIKIYSTTFIPLHLIAFYLLYNKKSIEIKPITIFFIVLYLSALFLREYSLLPTRLSYPIFWLSPLFLYFICKEQQLQITVGLKLAMALFVNISLIRFVIINDNIGNNISFNNSSLIYLNITNFIRNL